MATVSQLTAQQLALYLGQQFAIILEKSGNVHDFMAIDLHSLRLYSKGYGRGVAWRNEVWSEAFTQGDLDYIWKPILRRLSSLTDSEKAVISGYIDEYIAGGNSGIKYWQDGAFSGIGKVTSTWCGVPAIWLYLLSLGIDLFGWIDAGLAIDKATLQNAGN